MTITEMNERKRELGYTDARISELSGVPLSTVRKVLGGITKAPRFDTIKALEKVLGKQSAASGYNGRISDNETPAFSYDNRNPGNESIVFSYNSRDPGNEPSTFSYDSMTIGAPQGVREAQPVYSIKKQGEYTLEDYLAIPDERRVELIDGVIYDMSSPLGHHQIIAGQIHFHLVSYISGKGGPCIPFIAPVDVQLDCDDKTIVQPDITILCDRSKYTPQRIVGAPDFVVEVLSKSTRKKDIFIKLNKYRSAGVREYWMVDPDKKNVMVYHFENDDDLSVYTFRDKVPVGIYCGDCVIDFAPIDDFVSQLPH